MKNYLFIFTITIAAIMNTSVAVSAQENPLSSSDSNTENDSDTNVNLQSRTPSKSELWETWNLERDSKQDLLTKNNFTFADTNKLNAYHLSPKTKSVKNHPIEANTIEIAQVNSAEAASTTQQPLTQQDLQQKLELLQQKQQQLEQEIETLRQQISVPKPELETPVVSVPENKPQSVEVSAQLLFLQPNTSNLMDFAIVDPGASNTLAVSGDIASLDYDDADSLRIGLTYRPPNTAWDITASRISFTTEAEQSVVEPTNGFLFSTITHPFQNESALSADASTKLDFSTIDIELGHTFKVGKNLGLRLFGGLHFSDIDQKMAVNYDGRDFNNSTVNIENSFRGFGPRIGSEIKLNLGNDLSIFSKGAASLLLGDLDTTYQETDNNGADVVARVSEDRDHHIVPGMELTLGLNWKPQIAKNSYFNFSLGYEYQYWFNVANSIRFVDSDSPGTFTQTSDDLSLQGLFMQFGISSSF